MSAQLISSHLNLSHLLSSHLISSHLITSHLNSIYLISSHLSSSYLISPSLFLWKTITFAPHTEGQPKLKFSESEISPPPTPMENLYFSFAKLLLLLHILRANLSLSSASPKFPRHQQLWKTFTFPLQNHYFCSTY